MTLPNLKPIIYKLFFNETPKLPGYYNINRYSIFCHFILLFSYKIAIFANIKIIFMGIVISHIIGYAIIIFALLFITMIR